MNNEHPTLYKRNAGFIDKLNNTSRNKILDKMKISSPKTRTTLILNVRLRNNLLFLITLLITFNSNVKSR